MEKDVDPVETMSDEEVASNPMTAAKFAELMKRKLAKAGLAGTLVEVKQEPESPDGGNKYPSFTVRLTPSDKVN